MADIGERLGGDNIEFTVDKPLRIIIGGPPHSGKSTFMNLLEDRFRYYQIPVELLDLDLSAPTPLKTGFTQQREKKKWTSTLAEEAREMFEGAEGVQVVLGDSVGLISDINEIISQPADVAILLVSGGHGDYDTTYRKVVRKWKEYYQDIRTPLLVVLRSTMNPRDESMFDPQDNYGVVVGMDRDAYDANIISGHYKYDGIYPTNACLEGVVFEIAQSFDLKVRSATDPEHLNLLNQKWPDLKDKKTWTPPEGSMMGRLEKAYYEERGIVPADQRAESFGADFKVGMDGDFDGHEEGDVGSEHIVTYTLDNGEKVEVFEGYTVMSKDGMNSGKRTDGYLIGIKDDNQWWQPEGGVPTRSEINAVFGADKEYFRRAEDDLSFKEWADQETMTHGQQEPFDDWLNDELSSHGDNVSLQDWGQHELDSHYERYGAEGDPKVRRLKTIAKWINDNHGDTHFADMRDTQYGYYNAFNQYITKDGKKLVVYELTPKGEYPRRQVFSHNPLESYRTNKEVESWVKSTFTSPVTLRYDTPFFYGNAEDNLKALKAIYNPYIGKQVRFITKYGLDKDDMFVDIETIHSIDWDGGEDEYDEPVFLNKEGDRWMTLDYVKENLVENKAAEGMTSFDVINIEYSNGEEWNLPDSMVGVIVEETDVSATEDRIREKVGALLSRNYGGDIKVVDFTAFYTGTTDPLRGNYEDYEAEDNLKELKAIYNPYIGKQVRFITKYGLDKDDMFVDIETIHSIDWDGGEDEYDEPVFLNKEGDRWMTLNYVKENLVENKEAEGKIHSQLMIGSLIGLGAGLWAVNRFKESREEQ